MSGPNQDHDILGEYVARAAALREKLSVVISSQREVAENLQRAVRALRSLDFAARAQVLARDKALASDSTGGQ